MTQYEAQIRELIHEIAFIEDAELDLDTPLLEDILASEGIVEVAALIGTAIGRELTADERTASTFFSMATIIEFIEQHEGP